MKNVTNPSTMNLVIFHTTWYECSMFPRPYSTCQFFHVSTVTEYQNNFSIHREKIFGKFSLHSSEIWICPEREGYVKLNPREARDRTKFIVCWTMRKSKICLNSLNSNGRSLKQIHRNDGSISQFLIEFIATRSRHEWQIQFLSFKLSILFSAP